MIQPTEMEFWPQPPTLDQLKIMLTGRRRMVRENQRQADAIIKQIVTLEPLLRDQYLSHWIGECRNCCEPLCSECDHYCPKCEDSNPFDDDTNL